MNLDEPVSTPAPQAQPRPVSLANTDGAEFGTFVGTAPEPAPAPAATPAPAAPLEIPTAPPAAPAVVFESTGDPGLDTALKFFGGTGIDPNSPEMQAAKSGDLLPLAAKLGTLGDKARGFEGYIALAKASFDRQAAAAAQESTALLQYAGGQEAWDGIRSWAASNLQPAQRAQVNAALKQGGYVAQLALDGLKARIAADPNQSTFGAQARQPGAVRTPGAAQGLTAADFAQAVRELRRTQGFVDGTPAYEALVQRREVGRRAGI